VYVSSSLGAGDQDSAHRVGRRTIRLGLVSGAGLGVVTAGLAFTVPVLFTSDPGVRHAALVALLVAAVTQPLAALAFVFDGLILGLSDYVAMRRAMILAVVAYVPAAALVLRFHELGLPGIWIALGLWLAARAALLDRRWRAQFRGREGPTATRREIPEPEDGQPLNGDLSSQDGPDSAPALRSGRRADRRGRVRGDRARRGLANHPPWHRDGA
jgi:Na+-driven multidrug efflux pump